MRRRSRARKTLISRGLQETFRERGLRAYATARQAGVSMDAVRRFLNRQRGLTLATMDKLTPALELTFCPDESATDLENLAPS